MSSTTSIPTRDLTAYFRRGRHHVRSGAPQLRVQQHQYRAPRHYAPLAGRQLLIVRLLTGAAWATATVLFVLGSQQIEPPAVPAQVGTFQAAYVSGADS
jgi:hypothetical protein